MAETVSSGEKMDTLRTMYSQVQKTALTIRDYLIKLTTGTSALFLALDGWILTSKVELALNQRIGVIAGIILLLGVASYAAYRFYREFRAVARLIVQTEIGLGVYEKDFFIPGRSLYPQEYIKLGEADYEHGRHIFAGPVLVMSIFGVFSIILTALI